jgi:hypothetical protein
MLSDTASSRVGYYPACPLGFGFKESYRFIIVAMLMLTSYFLKVLASAFIMEDYGLCTSNLSF